MYQAVLADARFHEQLLVFDRDLSAIARAAGCGHCDGALHAAPFGRKPRGGPAGLGGDYTDALALHPVRANSQPERRAAPISVDQRITAALADGGKPRPFSELRAACRVRTTTLYERLAAMTAAGLIVKSADGYCLAGR